MNKRFTLCEEQEYTDGWSIGITDHQTKEPFDSSSYMFHSSKQSATKEEMEDLIMVINQLSDENNYLKKDLLELHEICAYYENRITELDNENEQLTKDLHLMHIRTMFSTVQSFKGNVSKRYKYSKETDSIYDTANNYGQYNKILDKAEIVMLLNEYETVLDELKGDVE